MLLSHAQHAKVLRCFCAIWSQLGDAARLWCKQAVFCRHIVASQVYGEKVQSKKPADKWLAKSVEFLMQTYPAMRIAYIDNVDKDSSGKGTPMSVLLRWDQGVHHSVCFLPLSRLWAAVQRARLWTECHFRSVHQERPSCTETHTAATPSTVGRILDAP